MTIKNNLPIIIILAGLVAVTAAFLIVIFQFSAPEIKAKTEMFVIGSNTSEEDLTNKLKNEGFIRSGRAFKITLKIMGWQGKIKPGGYEISKSMNVWSLARVLAGHISQKWITVQEGMRKEEIAELMQKKLGWQEKDFEEFLNIAKEGYLFPDTYLVAVNYTGKQMAERMMNQFNEKAAELFKQAVSKNIRNDTVVVLASLVQREAGSEKEMPLVASVIWNRWITGMPFGIDAAIQYALGEPGNWWKIVKPSDYKVESPYNTYTRAGRPPAPISNPGLAAMEAVINFPETGFLYYIHDPSGKIHLAKNYQEHLRNIQKYLK